MSKKSKLSALTLKRLVAVAAVPTLSILALLLTPHPTDEDASAMYLVSNDSYVDLDDPSANVFLTDGSAELVSRQDGSDLRLAVGQDVKILYNGETFTTVSSSETVSQLLHRMGIEPSPLEMVAVAFQEDGAEITVDSEFVFYERIGDPIPHEVVYKYNDTKPDWHEAVIQEGHDGGHTELYEIIYQDGEEISRQLIESSDAKPLDTIIEKGTLKNFANNDDAVTSIKKNEDGSGSLILENGKEVTYREARTMRGTAYTAWESAKVDDTTATGTKVRLGTVAVDRKVIPLGTKVYVVSNDGRYQYGFAIAEDTGVRGNHIDLYMETLKDCLNFGVRDCTVYILD